MTRNVKLKWRQMQIDVSQDYSAAHVDHTMQCMHYPMLKCKMQLFFSESGFTDFYLI